jgi:hypothetical protein
MRTDNVTPRSKDAKRKELGVRIQELEGLGFNDAPGGEPLSSVPKDLAIFFRERGRPNRMLNRRLPGITARDVLSIVPFGDYSSA